MLQYTNGHPLENGNSHNTSAPTRGFPDDEMIDINTNSGDHRHTRLEDEDGISHCEYPREIN